MKANKNLNHTVSHILALAILQLFPNTKLGFGPPTDEGFYYDFEFQNPLVEQDLLKIEKQMKKIISLSLSMIKQNNDYKYNFDNQPYKNELYNELVAKKTNVSFYSLFDSKNNKNLFTDLCKGGHLENIKNIKYFKLLSLAGAYWRGDSNNIQLTRIYGTAWETQEELDNYLNLLIERKERDHRKLGKELNLFTFDTLAGQGFPIWLEDGMKIKNAIMKKILFLDKKYGFKEVLTPIVGSKELYEISGHWAHYKSDMFKPIEVDNESLVLRPMTCPHHILIYRQKRKSYREFPIRISEQSNLFRYEKSGALTGMERVRSMMLTEGHIFVREDQIVDEFKWNYQLIKEALDIFNIKIDYVSLSLRDIKDKEKYFDDDKMWDKAEHDLKNVLEQLGIEYETKIGEAAFYGPKIDIQIKTVLGHEITLSTLQLDFLLPRKFNLTYIDREENIKMPIMVHRGLIGTYERFLSILLEQTKGNLDFWLSPNQIVIIPINNEKHLDYADFLFKLISDNNFHVSVDSRNERISKKIREAQISKAKIQIVIGDDEIQTKKLSLRFYGSQEVITIEEKDLINYLIGLKNGK
ncbi:MAG: threonine--tRNA ligase [Metamycoplasmataceae bacterium]